jgi:glutamate-1-semialdehyde 2,1-aminomutase
MNKTSKDFFKRACNIIPGGVNSPVRAFNSVETSPAYIKRGKGASIWDIEDNKYIDFCGSWGPLILGHAHPAVIEAVQKTAAKGLTFGACCPEEVEFAELFLGMVPHAEMVRTVSSGTEAVMTALRLARGVSGKTKIIKFDGCYHGHSDQLLISAGSGLLTQAISSSKGVTPNSVSDIITAPYNDIDYVREIFASHPDSIAALIVEPVAGNMGLVMPQNDFLNELRNLCSKHGTFLIFDEVITGFRFHAGSYAELAGVIPDISVFGKIIGGGMPIGAITGSKAIMQNLAPSGEVYQAGTLSGNPVALAAGIATLKILRDENPYQAISKLAELFRTKANKLLEDKAHCSSFGGAFTVFFSNKNSITNLEDVQSCDTKQFAQYYRHMLKNGIYLSPSQFELNFISAAHTEEDIMTTLKYISNF